MSIVSIAKAKVQQATKRAEERLDREKRVARWQALEKARVAKELGKEFSTIREAFPNVKIGKQKRVNWIYPRAITNRCGESFHQEPFQRFEITTTFGKYYVILTCGFIPDPYDGDPDVPHLEPSWGISYYIDGNYYSKEPAYEKIAAIIAGV